MREKRTNQSSSDVALDTHADHGAACAKSGVIRNFEQSQWRANTLTGSPVYILLAKVRRKIQYVQVTSLSDLSLVSSVE